MFVPRRGRDRCKMVAVLGVKKKIPDKVRLLQPDQFPWKRPFVCVIKNLPINRALPFRSCADVCLMPLDPARSERCLNKRSDLYA